MNRTGSSPPQNPQGSALLLSLIFIAVFAALVTELPVEGQFDGLHTKLGTFIMAPGCAVSFSGTFSTLNGAIAANGVSFSGNAGGVIEGSVLNHANTAMELSGSSDLLFNRSSLDRVPAGFVPRIVMYYDPSSYTEAAI
jgi:hypothetical protein